MSEYITLPYHEYDCGSWRMGKSYKPCSCPKPRRPNARFTIKDTKIALWSPYVRPHTFEIVMFNTNTVFLARKDAIRFIEWLRRISDWTEYQRVQSTKKGQSNGS